MSICLCIYISIYLVTVCLYVGFNKVISSWLFHCTLVLCALRFTMYVHKRSLVVFPLEFVSLKGSVIKSGELWTRTQFTSDSSKIKINLLLRSSWRFKYFLGIEPRQSQSLHPWKNRYRHFRRRYTIRHKTLTVNSVLYFWNSNSDKPFFDLSNVDIQWNMNLEGIRKTFQRVSNGKKSTTKQHTRNPLITTP